MTKAQLEAHESAVNKSNNPVRKFMAKVTGKKSISEQVHAKTSSDDKNPKAIKLNSDSSGNNSVTAPVAASQGLVLDSSRAYNIYQSRFGQYNENQIDKKSFTA